MKWQNQNGGDQTYSPIRNRAQSVSATGNRSERLFGTSFPNSKVRTCVLICTTFMLQSDEVDDEVRYVVCLL